MNLSVRLFAVARQIVGESNLDLELPDAATVADLRRHLCGKFPALSPLLDKMMIAVDSEYADNLMILAPNSNVAIIPPVSGGCDD